MKKILLFTICVISITLFFSCNKDYSAEGSGVNASGSWNFTENSKLYDGNMDTAFIYISSGTKVMHLEGATLLGDQFFRLDLMTNGNFTPGTYTVSAGEVAFSLKTLSKTIFQSDITAAGEFTVTITQIGNNKISGTFSGAVDDSTGATQNIQFGQFATTINLLDNNAASVGTLGSSSNQCTPSTVSGTYTNNVSLNSSNTAQVQVNVTSPGDYTISTNTVNGISFSSTGTFTNTGVQTVTLAGTGKPTAAGTNSYTVTYGTSICNFSVVVN